jgi:hypothetical protein
METTPRDEPALTPAHLPQPRGRARWRWSTPGRAVVAGGTMAAVLGLGAGVAGATSASTASASSDGTTSPVQGKPPQGTRPTIGGKITALSGTTITVRTRDSGATTIDYSAGTKFTTFSAKGSTTSTSASALKVGDFVGVIGTKESNGTVSATTIMISTGPPGGSGTRPPAGGSGGARPAGGTDGAPPTGGPPRA